MSQDKMQIFCELKGSLQLDLEAEMAMLEENSHLLWVSAKAAILCIKTISNDALFSEHPRLGCSILRIKSWFYCSAAE